MFTFKFEKDDPLEPGAVMRHVTQGKSYDVVWAGDGSAKDVRIPNDQDVKICYCLKEGLSCAWQRCYVMNSDGKTVDVITA